MSHVDTDYFKQKLTLVVRDLSHYTPQELARELVRLAKVADEVEAVKEEAQQQDGGRDAGEETKLDKLLALADRIDHEQLWRLSWLDQQKLTEEQKDRILAGVMLRRYASILEPGRWIIVPPTGGVQFSAGTLEKAFDMAKRDAERRAAMAAQQRQEGGA